MSISLNLPVNPISFGQVSVAILRELYTRDESVLLSLIANQFDLSPYREDKVFENWLHRSITMFSRQHNRNNKAFRLWHINGSLESVSKEQVLLSFYELDNPTSSEINIVKNNHKVLFSSRETVEVFKEKGCENVGYIPLGFDADSFKRLEGKASEDKIIFSVLGKFEKRKHHEKLIKAWLKKYGNKKEYALHCAIYNPHLSHDQNESIIASLIEGKRYFNVVFSGFMQTNEKYNDLLNSADVVIGMSGGEGWGLPEFQSVAMGKHSVILNCSGYKGWANEKNSVLIEPKGKIEPYDEMFFRKDAHWNQGLLHDFKADDFIDGCEEVIKRVNNDRLNKEGVKLQEDFSYAKMVDQIIKELK